MTRRAVRFHSHVLQGDCDAIQRLTVLPNDRTEKQAEGIVPAYRQVDLSRYGYQCIKLPISWSLEDNTGLLPLVFSMYVTDREITETAIHRKLLR